MEEVNIELEEASGEDDRSTPTNDSLPDPPETVIEPKFRILAKDYDFIIEMTRCMTCNDKPMELPFVFCEKGHICCYNCSRWMEVCFDCFSPITDISNNNMEELVREIGVPCSSETRGCDVMLPLKDMYEHSRCCPYTFIDCPLRVFYDTGCLWAGLKKSFFLHALEHRHMRTIGGKNFFFTDSFECSIWNTKHVILIHNEELFVYCRRYIKECWFSCLQQIGLTNKKFSCTYELKGINGVDHIRLTLPVVGVDENFHQIFEGGKCFRMIDTMMANFILDDRMNFKVFVYDVTKERSPETRETSSETKESEETRQEAVEDFIEV